MKTFKESDLSLSAKQFLLDQGCTDVYGEVRDIDLVGKNSSLLIGIELKKSLNITVLAQAANRTNSLNYVYIGIPRKGFKTYRQLSPVYKLFIEHHKLGLVLLDPPKDHWKYGDFIYYEIIKHPKINRITPHRESVEREMNDFTKDRLGGQTSSEVITPYKFMRDEVYNYLKAVRNRWGDGWKTIDEILEVCKRVENHYSNPRGSLYQLLNRYSWIEKSECNKKYRYKITEER